MSNADKLVEFHQAFDHPILPTPGFPPAERVRLRVGLIKEEFRELRLAIIQENIVGVADAIGDLLYVAYGAALEFGVPIDLVFAEIHRSNMTKLGPDGKPIYRADGKILKGAAYDPPHLEQFLGL